MDEKLFCLERLELDIMKASNGDGSIQTDRIIRDGFACFIQFARTTENRFISIKNRIDALTEQTKQRYTFKWWFLDKVLPNLVSWVLIGFIGWLLLVNKIIILNKEVLSNIP